MLRIISRRWQAGTLKGSSLYLWSSLKTTLKTPKINGNLFLWYVCVSVDLAAETQLCDRLHNILPVFMKILRL